MGLDATLSRFFSETAPIAPGDVLLAAFSGGGDSTALLVALRDFARRSNVEIRAAHVDHGLDPGSAARAEAAAATAQRLEVPLTTSNHRVPAERRPGESLEVAARRVRYHALERVAETAKARYVATAHHRDDQAETVLMRLAGGHGVAALGAIPPRRGPFVRPLLEHSPEELRGYLRERHVSWIEDPTNADLSFARNRIRAVTLPLLEAEMPQLRARLASLAKAARSANRAISEALDRRLSPTDRDGEIYVARGSLAGAPPALLRWAVPHLLRKAGGRRQPSARALEELERRLVSGSPVGLDVGNGWRIEETGGGELRICRQPVKTPEFEYRISPPAEVRLTEISARFRLQRGREEPWMFRGDPWRAGLVLPEGSLDSLTVRNRRPGDRVQPLGRGSKKKLKKLLNDRRIPGNERDRLPLLCHSSRILWVPGVTIDHHARIAAGREVWIAEIVPDE